ncbi:hypothetical protein [Streptomyces soliscabiei]|uniref:hypothetical protein n=1 Tax=Streptomyces soliscabiei TaxID=588897 RepID=UPI0029A1BE8E|nr:hypothetical protein [Streptomyces sp. NY05-11A]MDX2680417.1 hypothetical protein [Streptomyces sp. NY05-11A]
MSTTAPETPSAEEKKFVPEDFPPDLRAAQLRAAQLYAALHAHQARLPFLHEISPHRSTGP